MGSDPVIGLGFINIGRIVSLYPRRQPFLVFARSEATKQSSFFNTDWIASLCSRRRHLFLTPYRGG
jgi:hypothetical protein